MPTVPRLLAVSDRRLLAGAGWEEWCSMLARLGVDGLQVRERDVPDREVYDLVRRARRAFPAPGILLVNRRLDIALAANADGVHLPAQGLPTRSVRAAVPESFLIGRSTHTPEEVEHAAREGADYALFGPVHATPSKLGRIEPRGVSSLRAAASAGLPVLGIGGLDATSAPDALAAGAHGIAAIRALTAPASTRDLVEAVFGRRVHS